MRASRKKGSMGEKELKRGVNVATYPSQKFYKVPPGFRLLLCSIRVDFDREVNLFYNILVLVILDDIVVIALS